MLTLRQQIADIVEEEVVAAFSWGCDKKWYLEVADRIVKVVTESADFPSNV